MGNHYGRTSEAEGNALVEAGGNCDRSVILSWRALGCKEASEGSGSWNWYADGQNDAESGILRMHIERERGVSIRAGHGYSVDLSLLDHGVFFHVVFILRNESI